VFLCIPLVWIFLNIYFLLNRKSKLKEVDFERFTKKITRFRTVLIVVKCLAVISYSVLSVVSIESREKLTQDDKIEIYIDVISTVIVLLFLGF
jgi:heme/copper-type cytochrome/quinol oxidase subunit 2